MSNNASQQIVNAAWNFAHVLRDDRFSYIAHTEQITFLHHREDALAQLRRVAGELR